MVCSPTLGHYARRKASLSGSSVTSTSPRFISAAEDASGSMIAIVLES